jgi:hypothetical protein
LLDKSCPILHHSHSRFLSYSVSTSWPILTFLTGNGMLFPIQWR